MSESQSIEKGGGVWLAALTGAALGGYIVALLFLVSLRRGWYSGNQELLGALAAALAVWSLARPRVFANGLLGVAASLTAMLLGDVFISMASSDEWTKHMIGQFGGVAWPKAVRYAFGMYIGGYLGYYGRAGNDEEPK